MLNIFSDKTESPMLNSSLGDSSQLYHFYLPLTRNEYFFYCYLLCADGDESFLEVNNRDKIEKYKQMMEDGIRFDCPFIKIEKNSYQQGRHRMEAAAELYGGDAKFPVIIFVDRNLRALFQQSSDEEFFQKFIKLKYDGTPQSN